MSKRQKRTSDPLEIYTLLQLSFTGFGNKKIKQKLSLYEPYLTRKYSTIIINNSSVIKF